jgi:RNA polymerase sigma-70 factor (ECF subfamily)
MPDPSANTVMMHKLIDRMRSGDLAARDELLRSVCGRLEQLARRMLRRFPGVRRFAETDDVLQNALMRLLRALQEVRPDSMRDFFNLAAVQMRRELLDMARHFYSPRGKGAEGGNRLGPAVGGGNVEVVAEEAGLEDYDADLERWSAFHEGVEHLPAEEREVVGLIFYHGWPQAQIAELFGVDERTIRRRWRSACLKLHDALHGNLPELAE